MNILPQFKKKRKRRPVRGRKRVGLKTKHKIEVWKSTCMFLVLLPFDLFENMPWLTSWRVKTDTWRMAESAAHRLRSRHSQEQPDEAQISRSSLVTHWLWGMINAEMFSCWFFWGVGERSSFKENEKRKVLLTFRCCICSKTLCISLESVELSCLIKIRTVIWPV